MKTIKLLLIISQMLVGVKFINAQAVMPNISYMYLSRSSQYELKFLFRDTYGLDPQKDTNFEYIMIPNESMLVNGNKVYHKIRKFPSNKMDTILYFDFDLKVNDKINRGYFNYLYVVDSIKSIPLLDGNFYMHWFLSSNQGGNLIWIKGLGDSRRGWIRDDAGFTPEGSPKLQAICRDNNLVYWYDGYNFFEPYTVKPTCNFDSLFFIQTSISPIKSNVLKIYPNPATSQLNITSNSNIKTILVYNVTCQLVKEINYENNNLKNISLAIDDLAQGMYMVQIIDELDAKLTSKFIKE
ncbi:MAG: T9SS type A sorting domain-containing protein [Candidatus Methylacidiphilales bacterium]